MADTALWTQQINDIITITNRPELTAETALALRQATLRAHACAHFIRDLVVSAIPNSDLSQAFTNLTIDISTLARFRDVSGVKLLDVNGNVLTYPAVDVVEIGDIYEPGYEDRGILRQNICWLAGTNLNIYSGGGNYGAEVTWFQAPKLSSDVYDSWIAQMFPDVIIWEACYFIWNRSGNDNKAKEAYITLHGEPAKGADGLYQLLKSNFLTTAGR
jgi:hypothetical protein